MGYFGYRLRRGIKRSDGPCGPVSDHRKPLAIVRQKLACLHRRSPCQPQFNLRTILASYVCSFVGIAVLAYLATGTGYPLIAAPFGATAVLVFGVPDSPFAQPRNVIGGNVMGAIISVALVALFGTEPWVMALAVATTIKVMQLTHAVHPPGGAVALVGVMSGASPGFVLAPVLVGSVLLVLFTAAFGCWIPGRPYPKHWL
ncbi:MAG: HPP family protein [Cyanobacteria bacterium Co-bin8]|nr:HPP family protein [Cyanobacteria bacterium Co-bin8]